jgi:urea carboxylase
MPGTQTAARIVEPPLPEPRFTFGGDEFVFCELDRAMGFHANFLALAICRELESRHVPGIVEIAQANASYLVRLDPDVLAPTRLVEELHEIHEHVDPAGLTLQTRIFDVPAYYNDPWTLECQSQFRANHQSPDGTDIEYVAEVNGLTPEEFVARHHGAPYYVTMVGFVPGTSWFFQMLPRERMLEVPKYIRPRTDTPALSLSAGGAFSAIYPVRGPGGYQLFGICPLPILDPTLALPDFKESFAVFRAGDIAKFRPIGRDEYDELRARVEEKTARYRKADVEFAPRAFFDDPDGYAAGLLRELYR